MQYVNITVSALRMELSAKSEKIDEIQELLEVAHDERDALHVLSLQDATGYGSTTKAAKH